jgi:hypothetical protein
MFEDQGNSNNATPPKNLPVLPDDIFAAVEPTTLPNTAGSISEQPDALEAGLLKKKEQETGGASVRPAAGGAVPPIIGQQPVSYAVKEPVLGKILATIFGVLIIGGLGVGGWWVYTNYFKESKAVNEGITPIDALPSVEPTVTNPVAPSTSSVNEDITNDQNLFGEQIDSDKDGLDDRRELDLSTDVNKPDSDSDGLSDGDEVLIWRTDPKLPDSDSDGYKDGEEVKNGYNPMGPGKLFNLPATTTTTSS